MLAWGVCEPPLSSSFDILAAHFFNCRHSLHFVNRLPSKNNANRTGSDSQSTLAQWLQTPQGKMVVQREQLRINAQLARATVLMPGRIIYQSRHWFLKEQFEGERVIEFHTAEPREGNDWPLPPEPVDLLLLPHEFELSDQPQAVLRWADTVLDDKGWLIITGFKPAGLLAMLFGQRMGKGWSRNRVSGSMLRLWLTEAGYKVIEHENWSYSKALDAQRSGLLGRLPQWLLPKYHGYLVAARKIDLPGTPMAARWKGLSSNRLSIAGGATASRDTAVPRNSIINKKV